MGTQVKWRVQALGTTPLSVPSTSEASTTDGQFGGFAAPIVMYRQRNGPQDVDFTPSSWGNRKSGQFLAVEIVCDSRSFDSRGKRTNNFGHESEPRKKNSTHIREYRSRQSASKSFYYAGSEGGLHWSTWGQRTIDWQLLHITRLCEIPGSHCV